jgi:DNA-binding Lrp family transcriptional regulator
MRTLMRDTSLDNYKIMLDKIPECERKVLEVIRNYEGITNSEIAQVLGVRPSDITGRTNSLVKDGIVKDGGKRTCKITKKRVHIWVYNDEPTENHIRPDILSKLQTQRVLILWFGQKSENKNKRCNFV